MIIRIFAVPKGTKLYSVDRGIGARDISSLSFNKNSTLLGVSSMSGLLQIYQLKKPRKLHKDNEESDEENLNDYSEKNQSEVTIEEQSMGLYGLRFLINKIRSFFVSTSLEYINACNIMVLSLVRPVVVYKKKCRKRKNKLSLQENKIIVFTNEWIYNELALDLSKRSIILINTINLELIKFS